MRVVLHFGLVEFSQNDYFVYGFGELPASEDQKMWPDGCCCVSVSLGGWVANVAAVLPAHFFGGPDLEIFALFFFKDVAITVAGVLSPSSEHDDV